MHCYCACFDSAEVNCKSSWSGSARLKPHFVRCIKPNPKNAAGSFERKAVVQQLQYQGVLQAIEVSRVGFPVRLKHRQAVKEFICLSPERVQVESLAARGQLASAARLLFERLSEPSSPVVSPRTPRTPRTPSNPSKVNVCCDSQTNMGSWKKPGFFWNGKQWKLWAMLCRGFGEQQQSRSRPLSDPTKHGSVSMHCLKLFRKLQMNGRGFIARKRVAGLRKMRAVLRLQSWQRGRRAREQMRLRKCALELIQSWSRARLLRKMLLQKRAAVPRFTVFLAFEAFSNPFEETLRGCHHNPETLAWTLRSSRSKRKKRVEDFKRRKSCSTDSETMAKPRRSQGAREGLGRVLGSGSQRHSSKLVLVLEIWFHSCPLGPHKMPATHSLNMMYIA